MVRFNKSFADVFKIVILVFSLLKLTLLQAQSADDYRPFIEEGKIWLTHNSNELRWFYFDGDTVIQNKTCQRFFCRVQNSKSDTVYTYLQTCMYEEDRRVWFFPTGTELPKLLYDFSVQFHDTTAVCILRGNDHDPLRPYLVPELKDDTVYVHQDGREEFHGRKYRIIHLWMKAFVDSYQRMNPDFDWRKMSSSQDFWIEGVGNQCGPDKGLCTTYLIPDLICCRVNGEEIYFNEQYNRDYYESILLPATFPTDSSVNSNSINNTFLDLSGRRLNTPPTRPGLYIKDGRKVMIK